MDAHIGTQGMDDPHSTTTANSQNSSQIPATLQPPSPPVPEAIPYEAWSIDGPAQLSLRTISTTPPSPTPNHAVLRIHAVSLNHRDLLVLAHSPVYPFQHTHGLIPCTDGAGVIIALHPASENSKWKINDRVLISGHSWTSGFDQRDFDNAKGMGGNDVDGVLARYVLVPEAQLLACPEYLSMEECAAVPTAGGTAWQMLEVGTQILELRRGGLRPQYGGGDDVGAFDLKGMMVVTQGTGGVSCFAIQLASAMGAIVIATSSSDEKLKQAKQLGAHHTINYRQEPQWSKQVLEITGGKGADHVLDVAGAGTIAESARATTFAGVVTLGGLLTEPVATDLLPEVLMGAKTLSAVLGGGSVDMKARLLDTMTKYEIHPMIGCVFSFEEADKAFEALKSQEFVGKIIIKC